MYRPEGAPGVPGRQNHLIRLPTEEKLRWRARTSCLTDAAGRVCQCSTDAPYKRFRELLSDFAREEESPRLICAVAAGRSIMVLLLLQ